MKELTDKKKKVNKMKNIIEGILLFIPTIIVGLLFGFGLGIKSGIATAIMVFMLTGMIYMACE